MVEPSSQPQSSRTPAFPLLAGRPGLFLALLGGVLLVHAVWFWLDQAPPIWDMAHHQWRGWMAFHVWFEEGLLNGFPAISDYYPPLYYLQEGLLYLLLGPISWIALPANLPALFLTAFFTWRLALRFIPSPAAEVASVLPLLFPMVAWTSRESLLDLPLTGWTLFALYLLVRSRWLQTTGWSLLFGAVVAVGLLTKWSFVFFLAVPVLWSLYQSERPRQSLRNLLDAALIAIPPVFWWYLPNAQGLLSRLGSTNEAARWELDPARWELAGWVYYPRVLASYYLCLPLLLISVAGLVAWAVARRKGGADWMQAHRQPDGRSVFVFLAVTLGGAWAVLTWTTAKDPRYVMPMVPVLALLAVFFCRYLRRGQWILLGVAAIQFLAVSFHLPGGPYKWALMEYDPPSDYRTLSQEWVLFQSQYFDVAGPPTRQDWGYDDLLRQLPEGSVVGFVPDAPRLHVGGLVLKAAQQRKGLSAGNLGRSPIDMQNLSRYTHVVGKTGDQGLEPLTRNADQVYRLMHALGWGVVWRRPLPDGSFLQLWRPPTPR
ncbi:MAG TPA: glycosyltransferase family 39 protein [Acidobacteriota bacterium]|nr:glycosyltransferase family 39 protein [Acidobacteriota bacterium]